MNTLVIIGFLGQHRCYLNVPLEVAKHRYLLSEGLTPEQFEQERLRVDVLELGDEFGAYDIWP